MRIVQTEGTIKGPKRTYLPIIIHAPCPECGIKSSMDMNEQYLMHPTIGGVNDVHLNCLNLLCGHEWVVQCLVKITLEPTTDHTIEPVFVHLIKEAAKLLRRTADVLLQLLAGATSMSNYQHQILCDCGPRNYQQDYAKVVDLPTGTLYMVADGMGGHENGARSSEAGCVCLRKVHVKPRPTFPHVA